jgi:nitrate reductase delta subunit
MSSTDTLRPASAPEADATQVAYAVASALLAYPGAELLDALPEMRSALSAPHRSVLAPLFEYLQGGDLIELQENYVDTFDRRRAHSLHLFEHILGDSRDRGQAMIDLRDEYLRHGLEPDTSELPDYVPLFLEFLAQIPADDAAAMLGEAIHVLARLGDRLSESGSPYAVVFGMLCGFTQVAPAPLPDLPDEAPEEEPVTFGPDGRGVNPVHALESAGEQPVTFYARDGRPMNTAANHHDAQSATAVPGRGNRP